MLSFERSGGNLAGVFALGLMTAGSLFAGGAGAAELKVISAGAVRGVIGAIIEDYARATGHTDAVAKVADGQAELAIVLISEIHAKGAKLAAPLPEPSQLWTVYSAAVPLSSTEPAHARAFIAAITSPAMRSRWTAAGWQPAK